MVPEAVGGASKTRLAQKDRMGEGGILKAHCPGCTPDQWTRDVYGWDVFQTVQLCGPV